MKKEIYTEEYKESMTERVQKIVQAITNKPWANNGRFLVSHDGQIVINVWDYIEKFALEDDQHNLRGYVSDLIATQRDGLMEY